MMMMMIFEEPCHSMGKDSSQYGRAVPQWPRVCHSLMMMMMVLLTNVSYHAFNGDVRFRGKQTIKGMDLEKTMMSGCSV